MKAELKIIHAIAGTNGVEGLVLETKEGVKYSYKSGVVEEVTDLESFILLPVTSENTAKQLGTVLLEDIAEAIENSEVKEKEDPVTTSPKINIERKADKEQEDSVVKGEEPLKGMMAFYLGF